MRAALPQANPSGIRVGVRGRSAASVLLMACAMSYPLAGAAQQPVPTQRVHTIQWWHGAIVVGGLSALMLLDNPTQEYFQRNRSSQSNDVAAVLRHMGQPEVYGTVTLGLLGVGLLSGEEGVTRAGGRLAATLAVAGATATGLKLASGRPRPNASTDEDGFRPFSGQDAMPSGHTTMAFALATSLADDLNNTWARVGLYTLAAGVGWSRMNDNKHWLTDVAAGAIVGLSSAKLVDGHWRIFNLHPPSVLLGPTRAGLVWHVAF